MEVGRIDESATLHVKLGGNAVKLGFFPQSSSAETIQDGVQISGHLQISCAQEYAYSTGYQLVLIASSFVCLPWHS